MTEFPGTALAADRFFGPDTRQKHDLWRRACANWLAGLVLRQVVDLSDAEDMAQELAYRLTQRAYRLPSTRDRSPLDNTP